ncbi:MAG: type IV secretory system conjugative DNA transfer family protein, partial [Betaproteobacteria bacterium]|nr:type IV secretory system conjugative DNA transfer family protein [Betaproteobacteria bacterium]
MSTHQPDLYHIPRAQKDITRFVWTALGLFTMIVLVSMWAATEYAAWALQWSPMLGKPMIAPAVYFPFDILVWTWKYNSLDYGLAVMKVFEHAHLIMGVGGLLSLLMPVALAFRRTRKAAGEKNDLHGSAHWAEPEEVEATGLLPDEKNAGGVFFGDYDDQYLRHAGPEHILAFAPTRSGKGVGIILPTLLSWKHSVLVNDIKGECWHFTSGWRSKALGQRCIKFDPASPDSARFNPLMEIRMDGNLIKDVQNIATMIVDPDGKGLNDHWAKTGFDLMTGIVLFVLLYDPIKDKSLSTVQAILSDGGPIRELAEQLADAAADQDSGGKRMEGSAAVMTAIRDTAHAMLNDGLADEFSAHGWRAAAQAAQSFLNKAGNEASGVQSTALSFLSLYRDPIVAENTRVSDFTLESLMQQATSLYLVVSPSDKDRLKPLLRLILNQTVRRLTESMDFDEGGGKSRYPHRLLLAIDEFPSLGKLDVFQEALAFIAGYGMKALLIVQDLSQLYAAYTKDESIISNCHIRIAYAPNKIETAELLSKMAGTATVEHTQRQYSGNRLAVVLQNVNTNEQIVSRPLLTADECMRLPPEDELVFVAGHAPI